MTIRLLVVDDHGLVREGLVRLLSQHPGFRIVGEAATGSEALERLGEAAPDVVLLDIALAGESGLDLIEPLLARRPETRILMLTMHADPEFAAIALGRGACGLLSKASSVEELVAAIEALARGDTLSAGDLLSGREQEILTLIGEGVANEGIAQRLSIRPKTVERHLQRLMAKLGIHTRAGLVAYARRVASQQNLA